MLEEKKFLTKIEISILQQSVTLSMRGMSYFRKEMSCKYADSMDQTSEICSTAIFQKREKNAKKHVDAHVRCLAEMTEKDESEKGERMKESSNISFRLKILIHPAMLYIAHSFNF